MNYFEDTTRIIIPKNKVVDYLLNTSHPDGWGKAKLFIEYGFHLENWEDFIKSIIVHSQNASVISEIETPFGLKILLAGTLETPSLKSINVLSVWIVSHKVPILVTIYPSGK